MLASAVVLTATASEALACVPQPMLAIERASGQRESQVTIEGMNFQGQVEVRWNRLDGPLLGSATEGTFSVVITVPDAPEGLYTVVALERQQDGSIGGVARAAFQVTADPNPGPDSTMAVATVAAEDRSTPGTFALVALGLAGAVALMLTGIAVGSVRARRRSGSTASGC